MSKVYTLSELKNILTPIFDEYGVQKAVLFGSYGKGTANDKSDIDLLVASGLRGLRFVGMLDAMTVLRAINVITGMMRMPVTKEMLMDLNAELNKIKLL